MFRAVQRVIGRQFQPIKRGLATGADLELACHMPEGRIVHGSSTTRIRGWDGSEHRLKAIAKPLDLEAECRRRFCFLY
jgi:hypothetical protein